ncbi:MAG: AtpZ/AtpI family protein [Candidatus Bipolaricaulia bacterium]
MREIFKAAALIGQLGLTVVATILASFGIGYLIDRWLGTQFFKLIFLLLGVGAGYWSAARQLRSFLRGR